MVVKFSIDMVNETLESICLWWGTDDEVDHSPRRCTDDFEQAYPNTRVLFSMESSQTSKTF